MTDSDFIERFEAFARGKPAGERYRGGDPVACALAQFGFPNADNSLERLGIPEEAYHAAITLLGPSTFGALADRLAALRASTNA